MLHDRGSIMALFVLPIAFILVMTSALEGVFDTGSEDRPIVMMAVNQDNGELAGQVLEGLRKVSGLTLIESIDGELLSREKMEDLVVAQEYGLGLIFPPDFSKRVLDVSGASSEATTLLLIADPTLTGQVISPARGLVEGYVERIISSARMEAQINQGFATAANQVPPGQTGLVKQIADQFRTGHANTDKEPVVAYEVVSPAAYHMEVEPTSVQQNVPAYTIYGVFFIMQTIATSFFREKNNGTFRRLQAAPISKAVYLIGKSVAYYFVNLIQIALMFAVGVLVYGLNLGNAPLSLVLISLVTSLAATGMGMMVTCFGNTLEQATSISTMLGVVLSVIGGMMVPVYVMPDFMQQLAKFTPHAWALSAYQDVIVRGLNLSSAIPTIGVLFMFAVGFWGIAIWRFKFE